MRETLALAEASDVAAAERASGSSFYNAMRILPRAQRLAMFEIYSFCRQVDDIADARGLRRERREELQRWRADIDALYAGNVVPRTRGLLAPVRDFGLRREDFHAIIDGMEMDVIEDIRAPDEATLDLYCNRVASAVGRLSVRVFGMEEQDGIALAHHLGRALQLTNILRDLDEDAALGRLYLPAEALREAGIATTDPAAVLASPLVGTVCARVVERARGHFASADKIMARSPRRCVRAPRIMGEAYRLILDSLVARGWSPPRRPIRLPRPRLLWIIMRHAFV
jgi:presqualene diphosphate synthase